MKLLISDALEDEPNDDELESEEDEAHDEQEAEDLTIPCINYDMGTDGYVSTPSNDNVSVAGHPMEISSSEMPSLHPSNDGASIAHPAPSSYSSDSDPEETQAHGPDNVSGYDKVDAIAQCLVNLRHKNTIYLSDKEARVLVDLWNRLDEHDKKKFSYPPRFKTQQSKGRYKLIKKSNVVPGTESVQRLVLILHSHLH